MVSFNNLGNFGRTGNLPSFGKANLSGIGGSPKITPQIKTATKMQPLVVINRKTGVTFDDGKKDKMIIYDIDNTIHVLTWNGRAYS